MYTKRTAENRVVSNDLVIMYRQEAVAYTDGSTSGTYYQVTRTATKKYKYVDMTYDGARNAADDLVTMYTRQTAHLRKRTSGQTVPSVVVFGNLTSKITPTRVDGDIWEVDVDVQETDVRASATFLSDPSTLFSAENLRDYDTQDDVILQILSTCYDTTYRDLLIRTSNNMTDDQRAAAVIFLRDSSSSTEWEQISSLKWIDENKILLNRSGITPGSTQIMLEYGGAASNTYTVASTAPTVRIQRAWAYTDGSGGCILANVDGDDFSYLPNMDIYMDDASSTTLKKFTGSRAYMTWDGGECQIASGAEIRPYMLNATRIMMIDATHASTCVTIGKVIEPSATVTECLPESEVPNLYRFWVSANETAQPILVATTSFTFRLYTDEGTYVSTLSDLTGTVTVDTSLSSTHRIDITSAELYAEIHTWGRSFQIKFGSVETPIFYT